MRRVAVALYLFVVALAIGGLGWVTSQSLSEETERRLATARADAAQVERLALWRLDSRLVPAWSVENNRNYSHYFAFYTPFPVVADGGNGEPVKIPSPIICAEVPDYMRLHFQLDRDAGWSSPQVVATETQNNFRDKNPEVFYWGQDNIKSSHGRRLADLQTKFAAKATHEQLMKFEKMNADDSPLMMPYPPLFATPPMAVPGVKTTMNKEEPTQRGNDPGARFNGGRGQVAQYQVSGYDARNDLAKRVASEVRNSTETTALKADVKLQKIEEAPTPRYPDAASRGILAFEHAVTGPLGNGLGSEKLDQAAAPSPPVILRIDTHKINTVVRPPIVQLGPMRPVWLKAANGENSLVLVRAAKLEDRIVFQGVLLDWPLLRDMLLEEIRSLLPDAKLERAKDAPEERRMTALPVALDPGPEPQLPPAEWTPLRIGLVAGWLAAVVALAGIGFAGYTLIDLSERRMRFVSAVTHELRTPLTAMRLYTDLLASGMIADEEKQKEYLRTLGAESERLHTLIENVLDFAKLERRAVQAHCLPIAVGELLDQVRGTWQERLATEGRELVVVNETLESSTVTTDARIAGQILGNFIDNARKYSRDAADKRIWLRAKTENGKLLLEVEDRGPGIPANEVATIFRPFRRGKSENATGGAGLGLALAKQWAGLLGGGLTLRAPSTNGAVFQLSLSSNG